VSIHSDWIPDYIKAQSPKGLRLLMFKTNAMAGTQFRYFDIQSYQDNGKTVWVAWFYRSLKNIGELSNDNAE
jgi:hypothetical protein